MLSLIIPSYNERENLKSLLPLLQDLLKDEVFEIIIVDDQSPDGTSDYVREIARSDLRIRLVERRGRKGLASACVEGFLSSSGEILAVMDADMQHDETLLLKMLKMIRGGNDVVLGSRFKLESARENFSTIRTRISLTGITLANAFLPQKLTDPMSGFFMIKREIFEKAYPKVSPMGFKVLFDLLMSYPEPALKICELPFNFRERHKGESKLDSAVIWDFLMYLAERLTLSVIPAQFISFSIIGSIGVVVHLSLLKVFLLMKKAF